MYLDTKYLHICYSEFIVKKKWFANYTNEI